MKLSKLCLGTIQLGREYGINNLSGIPSESEGKKILRKAIEEGINTFDTAPDYGTSEVLLGKSFDDSEKKDLIFISKVPPMKDELSRGEIIQEIRANMDSTMKNIGIKKIPIYAFDRFEEVEKNNQLVLNELKEQKTKGTIEKIGVSTYTPEEAEKALALECFDMINIPFNIVDKRLLDNGFLQRAKEKGIIVFVRSVFLQGLFFKKNIPENLIEFSQFKEKINALCQKEKISVAELALRYVLSIDLIDSILIGVEKKEQLLENIEIMKKGRLNSEIVEEINSWRSAPEKIVNPRLWNK